MKQGNIGIVLYNENVGVIQFTEEKFEGANFPEVLTNFQPGSGGHSIQNIVFLEKNNRELEYLGVKRQENEWICDSMM